MSNTSIQQLENEPIVIVTHKGELKTDGLGEFTAATAKIQRESRIPLYWVIDVSATTMDFAQVLKLIAYESHAQPGTAANAPNRVFLVGSEQMTRFFQEAMRRPQFGSIDIPIFPNLDDALAAVRLRIAAAAKG